MKQELIDRLPASWDELPFADFIELSKIKVDEQDEFDGLFVGVDNALKVISVLSGVSEDELGEMPGGIIHAMARKIEFLATSTPSFKNSSRITWKKIENISYDSLATYSALSRNPETFFDNMPTIIKEFCVDRLNEDQILQLSTQECFDSFFLLRKELNRFTNDTYLKGMKKLNQPKEKEMPLMKIFKRKRK